MSFVLQIENFVNLTNAKLDKIVRKVVMDIGYKLVMRSPVGDPDYWKNPPPPSYTGGRFRGNWQYGFGSAPSGELDTIDKSGQISIARIKPTMPYGVHYIVNNLPYAERLENGWSWHQAPQGIVNRVLIEFPGIVEQAAS